MTVRSSLPFFVLIPLLLSSAWASEEERLTSPFSGAHPYALRFAPPAQQKGQRRGKKEAHPAGLYTRHGTDWSLLIPGSTLIDQHAGPVFHHLQLGANDPRLPALAIIDGKIRVFNTHSKQDDENSFVTIGDQPVVDLATGLAVDIPRIQTSQQVHVMNTRSGLYRGGESQLVLISIASKSPVGDSAPTAGVTLALRLAKGAANSVAEAVVAIDGRFRTQDELAKLLIIQDQNLQVFSESLQRVFIQRLKLEQHADYQVQMDKQIRLQEGCLTEKIDVCDLTTAATWIANTGKAHFPDTLHVQRAMGNLSLTQRYGGKTNASTILVENGSGRLAAKGILNLNGDGEIWGLSSQPSTALVSVDWHRTLVVTSLDGTPHFANLSPKGPETRFPKAIAYASHWFQEGKDLFLYVVVSESYLNDLNDKGELVKGDTTLHVYQLDQKAQWLEPKKHLHLKSAFYLQAELNARLHVQSDQLAIDLIPPPTESVEIYHQARKETDPKVDLIRSESGRLRLLFTSPLDVQQVGSPFEYRLYQQTEHAENPSGLYRVGQPEAEVLGEVLTTADGKSFDFLKAVKPIETEKLGKVRPYVLALDRSHRKGIQGHTLVINLVPGNSSLAPLTIKLDQPRPISDLLGVRLLGGAKTAADQLVLAVFSAQNVITYPITIDDDNRAVVVRESKLAEPIRDLTPDEFVANCRHDQNGRLHLVLTPELSPNSRNFRVVNLHTGDATFPKREHGPDAPVFATNKGLNDTFAVDDETSKLSWKVDRFRDERNPTPLTRAKVADLSRSPLFAQLGQLLDQAADTKREPRHLIVLVPPEIKDLALAFVHEKYHPSDQSQVTPEQPFHRFNRDLTLYRPHPKRLTQDAFFENLDLAKPKGTQRGVVVADLQDLIDLRPESSEDVRNPFTLNVPQAGNRQGGKTSVAYHVITPHALYLLAAAGPVPLEEFREKPPKPQVPILLIGTRDEMGDLLQSADIEMEAGIDKAFEVIDLPPPTLDFKVGELEQIFARPDIQGLRFKFDIRGVSSQPLADEDAVRRKMFEYAVTRVDTLARQRELNPLASFFEFVKLLSERLLTDALIRQSRTVDRGFIERTLKTQFNLSLNLADLPPDDPRVMASGQDAVFLLQRAGFLGEFALKEEIIRTVKAQLNFDPARTMPSSGMWVGEPGTGKTRAFMALVKALKLKLYNENDPQKATANAFYFDPVKIRKDRGPQAVDDVIDRLHEFISTPAGQTGFIFIDDLSFASEDLGKALVQWVRGLQQAERGIYRFKTNDGIAHAVPVQNLWLHIAMNFSDNQQHLSQFESVDVSSTVAKIVATGSKYGIDKSFVDRFGGVFNFTSFHESVKEPSLNEALMEAAQRKFSRTGQYVLVAPELVREAAKAFPKLGARPFLSKATEAIIGLPDQLQMSESKVFAIVPRTEEEVKAHELEQTARHGGWNEEGSEVKTWVQRHARVIELEQGLGARLMLMRLMIPAFRSTTLEALVYSLHTDPRFKADGLARSYFLGPALMAIRDHLQRAETIPLQDLKLEPSQLGIKTTQDRELYARLLKELTVGQSPFLVPFPAAAGARGSVWRELGLGGRAATITETREDVLINFASRLQKYMHAHLLRILAVNNISEIRSSEQWLKSLPATSPEVMELIGQQLAGQLLEFMKQFQTPEMGKSGAQLSADPYASTRYFLMALDAAIARLPWGELATDVGQAISLASKDMVLGQSIGVQNWLFNPEDRASLLKPTTANMIKEMIDHNAAVRELQADEAARIRQGFESRCESYLTPRGTL